MEPFVDRQPKYPNRVLITPESGSPFYATMIRADEPTVVGTPINAATLNPLVSAVETAYVYVDDLTELLRYIDGSVITGMEEKSVKTMSVTLGDSGDSALVIIHRGWSDNGNADAYVSVKGNSVEASVFGYNEGNESWFWHEWEYHNPPMALNVEYRTTEKHQGEAVYTKLVLHEYAYTDGDCSYAYSTERVYPIRCAGYIIDQSGGYHTIPTV